jgi:hypothetical protein
MKAMAAAWGGGNNDMEEPSYSQRLRERSGDTGKTQKSYLKPWMVDPQHGGEVTPSYGENEVASLPINLGYSIIEE